MQPFTSPVTQRLAIARDGGLGLDVRTIAPTARPAALARVEPTPTSSPSADAGERRAVADATLARV